MADKQKTISGEGYIQYKEQARPTREDYEEDKKKIRTINLNDEQIEHDARQVEDRQSRDYWEEKNNARYEQELERKREAARDREHSRQMELVKAGRQPAGRTIVQNRFAPRRQSHPFNMGSIDFSSGMISSGMGDASGYSSPFRGMGLPGLEVRSMGLGTGMRQSAYTDPFRGMGIAMNRKSPLSMSSGVFARNAASNLLTEGIFSGKGVSIFPSPAPAPRRRKAPAKKSAGKTPVVYGNRSAAGGSVVIQKGKKTHKIPVKRLPPRKKVRP